MTSAQYRSRDDVLAVAEQLLAAEGATGLSVRRIAERLGVSRQIVYSRFHDKADLVRALHAEGFRRMTERMLAVADPLGSTHQLVAIGLAYRDAALASPALFELMFGKPVPQFQPDEAARAVAVAGFEPVLHAARAWLAEHGDARPDEAQDLALLLWSATHGVVQLEQAGLIRPEAAPAMIDRVVRDILVGTATAGGGVERSDPLAVAPARKWPDH